MTNSETQPKLKFRAQVRSLDGERWVDGALYSDRRYAERDVAELAGRYGLPVRVTEEATS